MKFLKKVKQKVTKNLKRKAKVFFKLMQLWLFCGIVTYLLCATAEYDFEIKNWEDGTRITWAILGGVGLMASALSTWLWDVSKDFLDEANKVKYD